VTDLASTKTTAKTEGKQSTRVEILGVEIRIRSDADRAYVAEVARFVDSKLKEIQDRDPVVARERLAILACMNIADQLIREREETRQAMDGLESRVRALSTLLEQGLAESTR
jgi:cell division protein ZapA